MNFTKYQPQVYNGTGFDKYDFYAYLGENQFQKYDAYVASEEVVYGDEIVLLFSVISGETLVLPLYNQVSVEIDWGDGIKQNWNTDRPSHIYNITSDVIVRIKGRCQSVSFGSGLQIYAHMLKEVIYVGNILNLTNLNFSYCANLTIVRNPFNCPNLTRLNHTFSYCQSLQSVPIGLFDNCQNVIEFTSTFFECRSLSSIPVGLFDNHPNVNIFYYTFNYCLALTGLAPELWLRTNVSNSYRCFYQCTNLSNYAQIPASWK